MRAHVQAVWLAETGADLGKSLCDLLDVERRRPDAGAARPRSGRTSRARSRARRARGAAARCSTTSTAGADAGAAGTREAGSTRCCTGAAAVRRGLRPLAGAVPGGPSPSARPRTRSSATPPARRTTRTGRAAAAGGRAAARAADARRTDFAQSRLLQLPLLRQRGVPARLQLPAAAAVGLHPGAVAARGSDDEFVSRPRFLAISRVRAAGVVYHEGSATRSTASSCPSSGRRRRVC